MSGSVLFPNPGSPSGDGSLLFGNSPGFQGGSAGLWKSPLQTPHERNTYRNGPQGRYPTPGAPALWNSTPAESNVADVGTPGGQSTSGFGPSPSPSKPQSIFYRDLAATPSATRFGDSQATAAAAAALWRESGVGPADLPPPPRATLEDQIERLPEGVTPLRPVGSSPDAFRFDGFGSSSPFGVAQRGRSGSFSGRSLGQMYDTSPMAGSPSPMGGKSWQSPPAGSLPFWAQKSPSSPGSGAPYGTTGREIGAFYGTTGREVGGFYGTTGREVGGFYGTMGRDGGAFPVAGVVPEQGALLTLPPPREVVRPPARPRKDGDTSADHWITVFGFGPDDINTVLSEFEKCGPMVDHVYGPGGANWIHIQYQSPYDAQRALSKNGLQLSPTLLVGVKPMDSLQLQSVVSGRGGPSNTDTSKSWQGNSGSLAQRGPSTPTLPSARPYYVQPKDRGAEAGGIAQPAKSSLTKFVDFVFGM